MTTEQPHIHAGNDANEVAVLLNIAHSTLMDEALRETYQSEVSPSPRCQMRLTVVCTLR